MGGIQVPAGKSRCLDLRPRSGPNARSAISESLKPYGEHLKDLGADIVKVAASINNFATRNLGFLV